MNVKEIIKAWLEQHQYHGLAGDNCGCELSDLMPCDGESCDGCLPGRKIIHGKDDDDCEFCHGEGMGWCIIGEDKEYPKL
jgi:hypothetical protein